MGPVRSCAVGPVRGCAVGPVRSCAVGPVQSCAVGPGRSCAVGPVRSRHCPPGRVLTDKQAWRLPLTFGCASISGSSQSLHQHAPRGFPCCTTLHCTLLFVLVPVSCVFSCCARCAPCGAPYHSLPLFPPHCSRCDAFTAATSGSSVTQALTHTPQCRPATLRVCILFFQQHVIYSAHRNSKLRLTLLNGADIQRGTNFLTGLTFFLIFSRNSIRVSRTSNPVIYFGFRC